MRVRGVILGVGLGYGLHRFPAFLHLLLVERPLELPNLVLGFGFWVLGFGFWVLGSRFLILGLGFWFLGLGLSV